jgi:hypothetical protein
MPMIFGEEKSMRKQDFYQKAMRCIPEISCKEAYFELLKQAHEQGLFKKKTVGNEVYYENTAQPLSLFNLPSIPSVF